MPQSVIIIVLSVLFFLIFVEVSQLVAWTEILYTFRIQSLANNAEEKENGQSILTLVLWSPGLGRGLETRPAYTYPRIVKDLAITVHFPEKVQIIEIIGKRCTRVTVDTEKNILELRPENIRWPLGWINAYTIFHIRSIGVQVKLSGFHNQLRVTSNQPVRRIGTWTGPAWLYVWSQLLFYFAYLASYYAYGVSLDTFNLYLSTQDQAYLAASCLLISVFLGAGRTFIRKWLISL